MATAYVQISRDAGSARLPRTRHGLSFRAGVGIAWLPVTRIPRDSVRKRHANARLSTHRTAAPSPGAARPHMAASTEPNAGPTITPRLVAAESQPSPFARSSGALASATYA